MSVRQRQLSFFNQPSFRDYARREHGGALRAGRRKLSRPVDTRRAMHVTMRSERAQGKWSLLLTKHERMVKHEVYRLADQFGVRVYQYANSGNHLHLLLRAKTRKGFQDYLRTLSGIVARRVTGAKKGVKSGRFWDALAFSCVIEWGKHFKATRFYVLVNELEGAGVFSRKWLKTAKPLNSAGAQGPLRCLEGLVCPQDP